MLALRTSPQSFGVAEAERVARELYGLAVSVSSLSGERDSNFRLRTAGAGGAHASGAATDEFVLKIQDVATDADSNDCLVSVLDHIAEQDPGLPVPRLLPTQRGESVGRFSRDGIDYATCLVSFLPGRLLAESSPSAALLQNVGTTLARLDRALQGFFHPSLTRRLAWDVRRIGELAQFSTAIESAPLRESVEKIAGAFRDCLPRLRGLRSQAIHGDCHASNLLVGADGGSICGILDFGDMIHAPLIFEPAVAMSELLTEAAAPLDSVATVLQGYAQGQALQGDEVELLYDIVTARHATTLLVHAWRRRYDRQGARALDASSAHAARSLHQMLSVDRQVLSRAWHEAAGTGRAAAAPVQAPAGNGTVNGTGNGPVTEPVTGPVTERISSGGTG